MSNRQPRRTWSAPPAVTMKFELLRTGPRRNTAGIELANVIRYKTPATRAMRRVGSNEGWRATLARLDGFMVALLRDSGKGVPGADAPGRGESVAAQAADDHGAGAEVDRRHEPGGRGRLDRFSGRERVAVDGLGERQGIGAADVGPRRHARAGRDPLAAAEDEVPLELDAVGPVVARRHVAHDVVVREGVGRVSLWVRGLRREDVERVQVPGRGAVEARVRERHPALDAVGPDHLVAADPAGLRDGHLDAVAESRSVSCGHARDDAERGTGDRKRRDQ